MLDQLDTATQIENGADVCARPCIFSDLSDLSRLGSSARATLARHARPRSYTAGSVVYYQDDSTTHLHVLTRGHVRLSHIGEDGFVTLFTIVAPGRTFGEAGMLDGSGYCETASTVGAADALAIDREWMGREGASYDELRMEVGRLIAARYRQHVDFSRGLYLPNLAQRLSHSLLYLLGSLGNEISLRGRKAECLGPEVTQRDLGSMARGTRENVNKTLRKWEKDGILSLEDRHIILLDRARMEEIALALD